MRRFSSTLLPFLAVFGLVLGAGCGGGGGSGGGNTGLSFVVPGAAGGGATLTVGDSSGNTLTFDSVEVVFREIEFELEDGIEECDALLADDDDCEEVEVGPLLVSLALDGSTTTEVKADVPPGFYDEVEFELHKVSSDDDDDATFLGANPGFEDISIRVLGSYNGNSFEFTSDVNGEHEIEFDPPFEVISGEPANVTISIDVGSWFRDDAGGLIDPATAGDGRPNQSVVANNIQRSIDAFEDDDHDGDDDHDENDQSSED